MKFFAVILLIIALITAINGTLFAQLEVTIKNIKNNNGNIRVGIFDNKESFLEKPVYWKIVKATTGEVTVSFENIPPGTYGVAIIHDENKNDELDKNFIGIPKEGFGFGNDAMGKFGPPSFENSSITVEARKKTINISLRYL